MTTQDNWYKTFFEGIALEMWHKFVTVEQTLDDVAFLAEELAVEPPAALLDLPCGNGRHALSLAHGGYHVTGIDIADANIAEARQLAAGAGITTATFLAQDMCGLDAENHFDGAYCFGNSWGYLPPAQTPLFLARLSRALKPGARFAIETYMVAEGLFPDLAKRAWYEIDRMQVLTETAYDPLTGRLDTTYTTYLDDRKDVRTASNWITTTAELCRTLQDAGLRPLALYSSLERDPYAVGDEKLILVSEKTGESSSTAAR